MTATCDPGWEWASNSLGQNPCTIAGALEAPCRGLSSYTLGPLNDTNYVVPQAGSALSCECNTVMYSLFMVCTVCQGELSQRWTFWSTNCGAVYVTEYPESIPGGTSIPHWAYLNVTTTDVWDPVAARAVVGQPESTASKPPVSTLSIPTGTSSSGTLLPTNISSNSGGTNAGAIAGGVVGGLAGIGILAALVVWFVMKKKRSKVAPSSAFLNNYTPPNNYPKYEPPPVTPGPLSPLSPPQMTYNPSDPSTFPSAFDDPSIGGTTAYPQTLYDPHAPRRGQYSGAAEV